MKKSFKESFTDVMEVIITFFIAVFFLWSAGTCSPLALALIIAGVAMVIIHDNRV